MERRAGGLYECSFWANTPQGRVCILYHDTIIKNMVVKIEELAKQPGIDAATASIIQDAFIEMLRGSGAI